MIINIKTCLIICVFLQEHVGFKATQWVINASKHPLKYSTFRGWSRCYIRGVKIALLEIWSEEIGYLHLNWFILGLYRGAQISQGELRYMHSPCDIWSDHIIIMGSSYFALHRPVAAQQLLRALEGPSSEGTVTWRAHQGSQKLLCGHRPH